MKSIRLGALLGACLLLCACNPLMRASWDTLRASVQGPAPLELTPAQVAATPYYQIKVRAPGGEAVMALVRQRGDRQFWVASTRQVLVTRDGLVVRSEGFEPDLAATRFDGDSPFKIGLHRLADNAEATRWLDFKPGYLVGVAAHSRFRRHGLEQVEILGQTHELLRIDEHLQAPGVGLDAVNRYWVDPQDGFIMQSLQQVTPDLQLAITQLHPYRGDAP
ncbi:Group 4 capsule polysaccharide lipoprotein gfcB, YjbF [compost metagenome]